MIIKLITHNSKEYWELFREAIFHAINRDFRPEALANKAPEGPKETKL